MSNLALLGGKPAIEGAPERLFKWPIITEEDEAAALEVIRSNSYSNNDITEKFEEEFSKWLGVNYSLAFCNGTMSLHAAMYAIGLGTGDEIICPTKTYWASVTAAFSFGATPVFCNIDDNLVIDPEDLKRCISPRTKAIMAVHYLSHPCDMDKIMAIAREHNILVIEDVSHAQGGLYKGKRLGTFGDVAAMSLMSQKSCAAGELGILVTNNKRYYERAIAFAHYDRNLPQYITESTELFGYAGIAVGGLKGRANQLCTALARVQLKYYDERCLEIRRAISYFFDLIEDIPGLSPIRVDESEGSNMAGWYIPHVRYDERAFEGLSLARFTEALRAEGIRSFAGANFCLHTHKLFSDFDLYGTGVPTRVAYSERDVRELDSACDKSIEKSIFSLPWFKHFGEEDKVWIRKYADAVRKVALAYRDLLPGDTKDQDIYGRWFGTESAKKNG